MDTAPPILRERFTVTQGYKHNLLLNTMDLTWGYCHAEETLKIQILK